MDRILFAITYLFIVAGVGIAHDIPAAWALAAVTAGLGVITEELRVYLYVHDAPNAEAWARVPAVASWIAGIAAGLSLII